MMELYHHLKCSLLRKVIPGHSEIFTHMF